MEGKLVVKGKLEVKNNGSSNFVSVGSGSNVVPNSGTDCVVVGKNLVVQRSQVQVFNQISSMKCNTVYRNNGSGILKWKSNGGVQKDSNYDMSGYEETLEILEKKSQFWKTLPSTGTVDFEGNINTSGKTTYQCSNENLVQVFNIRSNERYKLAKTHSVYFSDSCEGKTVLVNVHGTGTIPARASAMFFKGKSGYSSNGFSTCMTESILWNFPDADTVQFGGWAGGSSEWHGSVLVGGKMKFETSGQSGRTMVLGDLIQKKSGSEFHSYQFNPPMALPDCPGICG